LAAQRHRVDIKKPMDEAAKAIADFVTGDALIQQLTKRRKRYLDELAKEEASKADSVAGSMTKQPTPVRFLRD
jgi:flagella basal body P-ring formation protein FlgA